MTAAAKEKPLTPHQIKAQQIVAGMKRWVSDINRKRKTTSHDDRTEAEQCFDSGVFAASELLRRLTGDESLSVAVHEIMVWRLKERGKY
jgi:hypothetical protein